MTLDGRIKTSGLDNQNNITYSWYAYCHRALARKTKQLQVEWFLFVCLFFGHSFRLGLYSDGKGTFIKQPKNKLQRKKTTTKVIY